MRKLAGYIKKQDRDCLKKSLYVFLFLPLLAACSGGDVTAPQASSTTGSGTSTGSGSGSDTTGTIGSSGFPHTIVLTTPYLNSVENLGGGVYRRRGTLKVTDKFGNNVPDGTKVDLGIIDSVIAEGTTGHFTAGSYSLIDSSPTLSDGTPAGFNQASIPRNNVTRFIQQNDWVLITGILERAEDKVRNVGEAINSTILPVQTPFIGTNTDETYVVGASLLGVAIEGLVADAAQETWTSGQATTKDGFTEVRVSYPANSNTIHLGCGNLPLYDNRHLPFNSGRVFTVATAGGGNATLIDEGSLCFASIAGWTLTTPTTDISGSTAINLTLKDGGDQIRLPLIDVFATTKITTDLNSDLNITVTTTPTNISGISVATITVVSGADPGDQATITFSAGDATLVVNLSIP